MQTDELGVLRGAPRVLLHARVQVAPPPAHALLIRAPLEVARDLGPALTVRLVELSQLLCFKGGQARRGKREGGLGVRGGKEDKARGRLARAAYVGSLFFQPAGH